MYWHPHSTSTPPMVPRVKGRKSVNMSRDMYLSPIHQVNFNKDNIKKKELKPESLQIYHTNEEDTSEDSSFSGTKGDESNIDDNSQNTTASSTIIHEPSRGNDSVNDDKIISKNVFNVSNILYVTIAGIILIYAVACYNRTKEVPKITLNTLKTSFARQDDQFWVHIQSGVSEIINFDKPSVIILVYRYNTTKLTDKLLGYVSKYASCILNDDCDIYPILLQGNDLNTEETRKDYGTLIAKYGSLLEERHIMIVKDIDEIPGTVAQAFHSFCDEYTPLVKRALFLFTVRVDEFYEKALKQVVNILEQKWGDLDQDKLEPLITRVSSIVLQIKE